LKTGTKVADTHTAQDILSSNPPLSKLHYRTPKLKSHITFLFTKFHFEA